jgi:hypothetical protein
MDAHETTLADLGWKPFFSGQLCNGRGRARQPVRVMAVHRGEIAVMGAGLDCQISSRLPHSAGEEDRPTVGDWLLIDRDSHEAMRVLDRASLFKRRAPGDDRRLQLIAANVDTLFIVASCNQDFNVARLERYLVLAREVGVKPVIVLTKIDLADDPEQLSRTRARPAAGAGRGTGQRARSRQRPGWPPIAARAKRLPCWDHRGSANRPWSTPCADRTASPPRPCASTMARAATPPRCARCTGWNGAAG